MDIFVPGDLYYHGNETRIKSRLADCGISDESIGLLTFDSSKACAASKLLIEHELDKRGLLYRSESRLIEGFLMGKRELFVSMHIADPRQMFVPTPTYPVACVCGMRKYFHRGNRKVQANIWLRRIWEECQLMGETVMRIDDVDMFLIERMHVLGIASWDRQREEIDIIPYIVTDVTKQYDRFF